ncbi:hypothetical protein [Neolewinella persica]|uniref:hypothetical protein n=1 Tax=Neolewinella persica TaxID=70998 RepID=UPI000475432E|nr:hypothetical protein [Neolewinella persica]
MKEIILMRFFLLVAILLLIGCNDRVDDSEVFEEEEVIPSTIHRTDQPVEVGMPQISQVAVPAQAEPPVLGKILVGDFNGDQLNDTLLSVSRGRLAGYLTILSGNKVSDTLGLGREYGSLFNDFSWVDSSRIVSPGIFEEVTFSEDGDVLGSRKVEVQFDAIELLASEIGGGILAWESDRGWYWIHQAD